MTIPLDRITDPWELLEQLGRYPRMRDRAANYARFIALTASRPSAQQHMLVFDARRIFHVDRQTTRLDLERARLLAQLEVRARSASRPPVAVADLSYSNPHIIRYSQDCMIGCVSTRSWSITRHQEREVVKRHRGGNGVSPNARRELTAPLIASAGRDRPST